MITRQYLFRGKENKTGKWIEGSLISLYKDIAEIFYIKNITKQQGIETACIYVIPETIGQFIGMLDKNGNRIFEGDVVKVLYDPNSFNYMGISERNQYYFNAIVVYNEFNARFGMKKTHKSKKNSRNKNYYFSDLQICEIEIIGNIFDNPKLIE